MPKSLGCLIDLPPVWLLAMIGVVRGFDLMMPWGLFGPLGPWVGAGLVGLGLIVMALAAAQMLAVRTTIIPRRAPSRLVTTGIFGWSRNPIYLGDALVLAGVILWWDVPVAVPLVFVFIFIIQHRFILAEEAVLQAAFGPEFSKWADQTGRWFGRKLR